MINHRFLIGSISNHSHFYKQAYNALKPGGWIELVEMEALLYCDDDTVPVGSALREWGELIHEVFGKMGRPFLPVEKYKEHLEDAGFENVTFKIVKRPTCDWPKDRRIKEIGRVSAESTFDMLPSADSEVLQFCALNLLEGLEGFTMAPFTRVLHWRPEEVTVFLAKVRKDILRRRIHGYMKS